MCVCGPARGEGEVAGTGRLMGKPIAAVALIEAGILRCDRQRDAGGNVSADTGARHFEANELNCRLVFDTIYRPRETKLMQLAARRGIQTVSGVEMFVAQGTAQWEIWTGERARRERSARRCGSGAYSGRRERRAARESTSEEKRTKR